MRNAILSIKIVCLSLLMVLPVSADNAEATFRKLVKTYTLHADGSQEMRVYKELTLHTHTAMNGMYGESFIVYDPQYQTLKINASYTRQNDGTEVKTPANAFVEVLPAAAADAPAYNRLREMVVVHTGLELGATIVLDYSIVSRPDYLPEIDICESVKERSPIKEYVCKVEVPAGKEVHYELMNANVRPEIKTDGTVKKLTWTMKNVAPLSASYPTAGGIVTPIQQTASGVMPTLFVSTHESYAMALKKLKQQMTSGDEVALKTKLNELLKDVQADKHAQQTAIDDYIKLLSRNQCRLSLKETGYRLRPASEVVRSAYGTAAELTNLKATLYQMAGIEGKVVATAYRLNDMNAMGLSAVLALAVPHTASALDAYRTITDLEGNAISSTFEETTVQNDTITVTDDNTKLLADGIRAITLSDRSQAYILYAYANNSTAKETRLLPSPLYYTSETVLNLPDTLTCLPQSDVEIVNKVGKVCFTYKTEGTTVKVTRSIAIDKQLIAPEDYRAFYALMAEWRLTDNHTLILKQK